jgi:hypothetical protein
MSKLLLILLCLLGGMTIHAQKAKTWLKKGEAAKSKNDWPLAFAYFEQAWLLDSADFENTIPYAEASRMMKMNQKAEGLYQRLYDKDKGRLFPEGLFWLASLQRSRGEYDEAYRNFKKFIKKNKKSSYLANAEMQSEACKWALDYKAPFRSPNLVEVGKEVNTEISEFAPVFDQRNSRLLFTRLNDTGTFDVFTSVLKDSIFQEPVKLSSPGNEYKSIGSFTFDTDSNRVYFTCVANNNPLRKLCMADWDGTSLGSIVYLGRINELDSAEFTTPHISVFEGKEYLWFSSDMKGGEGQWDIWRSEIVDNGFAEPVNSGNVINTEFNELTPFVSADTIYFATEAYQGFGGYDLFRAEGNIKKGFERPENLGKPFNSSSNDLYYQKNLSAGKVFFSSNRENSVDKPDDSYPSCCSDIYMVNIPKFKEKEAYTNLEQVRIELPVRLYFHNDEPDANTRDTTTRQTYTQSYHAYQNLKPKYISENTKGQSKDAADEKEILTEEFFELHAEKGFEDLQHFRELVLTQLKEGKRLRILVRGFASPRAQTDYNVNLTKRRIASLVNDFRMSNFGVFIPYLEGTALNGGKLEFAAKPFGEYKADKTVSDDLFNEKESVYSPGACLERKIEIEAIEFIPDAYLHLNKNVVDLGKIKGDTLATAEVLLKNLGGSVLYIDSVLVSCGCTVPQIDKLDIAPGEEATLDLQFNPEGQKGLVSKTVTVYFSNGEKREIEIVAEIE